LSDFPLSRHNKLANELLACIEESSVDLCPDSTQRATTPSFNQFLFGL